MAAPSASPQGYEGETDENGKPHGAGLQRCANGDIYEGHWHHGRPNGRGIYKYKSGAFYDGEFNMGQRHGQGVYAYANGQVYDGTWQNGKRHGKGSFCSNRNVAPDQADVYEGEFFEGMQHGKGVTRLANGDTYKGNYVRGKRHGQGVLALASGDKYQGFWLEDIPHGFGAYTSKAHKRHFVGTFDQGVLRVTLCIPRGQPAKPTAPECEYPPGSDICKRCSLKKQQCPSIRDPTRPTEVTPQQLEKLSHSPMPQQRVKGSPSPSATPPASPAPRKQQPSPPPIGPPANMVPGSELVDLAKKALSHIHCGMGLGVIDQDSQQRAVVRVAEVASSGPLAHAGLNRGDYLLKFNNKSLKTKAMLLAYAQNEEPGTQCQLAYVSRDGSKKAVIDFKMGCNVSPENFRFLKECSQFKETTQEGGGGGDPKYYPKDLVDKIHNIEIHKPHAIIPFE